MPAIVLFGHSMGGIAIRAMRLAPNYAEDLDAAIITVATPHAWPPVPVDRVLTRLYVRLGTVRDRRVLLSIVSGSLDGQINSEASVVLSENAANAFVSGLDHVWTSPNHVSILYCTSIARWIAETIVAASESQSGVLERWRQLVGSGDTVLRSAADPAPDTSVHMASNQSLVLSARKAYQLAVSFGDPVHESLVILGPRQMAVYTVNVAPFALDRELTMHCAYYNLAAPANSSSITLYVAGGDAHQEDTKIRLVVQRRPAVQQAGVRFARKPSLSWSSGLLFGQVRIPLREELVKTLRLPRLPTDLVAYHVQVLDSFGDALAAAVTVVARTLATGEKKVIESNSFLLRWNVPLAYGTPYDDRGFEFKLAFEPDVLLALDISWCATLGLVARRYLLVPFVSSYVTTLLAIVVRRRWVLPFVVALVFLAINVCTRRVGCASGMTDGCASHAFVLPLLGMFSSALSFAIRKALCVAYGALAIVLKPKPLRTSSVLFEPDKQPAGRLSLGVLIACCIVAPFHYAFFITFLLMLIHCVRRARSEDGLAPWLSQTLFLFLHLQLLNAAPLLVWIKNMQTGWW